jgi:WD40 repeat protein
LLATVCVDGGVRIWQSDSGRSDLLSEQAKISGADATHPSGPNIQRLAFDPSGKFLLTQSGESTVRCYSIATGKVVSQPDPMNHSLLSPDGRFVFSMDSSGMTKLWNVSEDKATTAVRKIERTAQEAGVSNLVPSALSVDGNWVAIVVDKNTVRIAETATGKIRGKSLTHDHPVQRVIFGPRGENVLTIDEAHYTRVWRWENLEPGDHPWVSVSSGSKEGLAVMAHFDLNGRLLAALGGDNRLRIWDVASHTQATPPLHPRITLDFEAFSADGKRLVVVGKDHTVRLWDLSPCASSEPQRDHAIQPGMSREFTTAHLTALVQELAGARIDEQENVVPLDEEKLLATWQRFKDLQESKGNAP